MSGPLDEPGCRRLCGCASAALLSVALQSCVSHHHTVSDPIFSEQVVGEVAHLLDAWTDWELLLLATHVVEGVLRVDAPQDTWTQGFLSAEIGDPRVLMGAPVDKPHRIRMYCYAKQHFYMYPVYLSDLQRANGNECIVFLHEWHYLATKVGIIKPIMTVADMEPRRTQLEVFVSLAKRDPARVARIVARRDAAVERIVFRLRGARGCQAAVQSCYDEIGRMGAVAFPGILHAMVEALEEPSTNHAVDSYVHAWVPWKDPAYRDFTVLVSDVFDLLEILANGVGGVASSNGVEDRWRFVRAMAADLVALSLKGAGFPTVTRGG